MPLTVAQMAYVEVVLGVILMVQKFRWYQPTTQVLKNTHNLKDMKFQKLKNSKKISKF
jgi:hypothetical protein